MRFRLLSLTITVLILAISSRIAALVEGVSDSGWMVASVSASSPATNEKPEHADGEEGDKKEKKKDEEKKSDKEEKKDSKKDAKKKDAEEKKDEEHGEEKKEEGGHGGGEKKKEDKKKPGEKVEGKVLDGPPETDGKISGLGPADRRFSPTELDLLQQLSKRREELETWSKDVSIKESLLADTERRVDQKLAEMQGMRAELTTMLAEYQDLENAKIKSLVKIYETMKPKDAARIFDEVEMPILLLVIDRMKEKNAALVLASMDPKKAKQLTVELAEQRKLEGEKLKNAANAAPQQAPVAKPAAPATAAPAATPTPAPAPAPAPAATPAEKPAETPAAKAPEAPAPAESKEKSAAPAPTESKEKPAAENPPASTPKEKAVKEEAPEKPPEH